MPITSSEMRLTRSEARRLIKQGAVEINGKKVTKVIVPIEDVPDGSIIKVGKYHIFKLRWLP